MHFSIPFCHCDMEPTHSILAKRRPQQGGAPSTFSVPVCRSLYKLWAVGCIRVTYGAGAPSQHHSVITRQYARNQRHSVGKRIYTTTVWRQDAVLFPGNFASRRVSDCGFMVGSSSLLALNADPRSLKCSYRRPLMIIIGHCETGDRIQCFR